MPRYNWETLTKEYVTGNDELTLEAMSKKEGYPSIQSLLNKSAKEHWTEQRKIYRQKESQRKKLHDNLAAIDNDIGQYVKQTEAVVSQLVDEVETITRHLNVVRLMLVKGVEGIKAIDPKTLKPMESLSLTKTALELERLTNGLATEKIDIENVSDEELEKLAHGG